VSAGAFLASLDSPEREVTFGMVFLWTLVDDREVTTHRDAVLWLADYAAEVIARDAKVVGLTFAELREYAREHVGAFVAAARVHRPDVLAACETASGGDA